MKKCAFLYVFIALFIFVWAAPVGAQTILEFPSWQATEPGTADFWKALIEEFEHQNPDVEVELSHVPRGEYDRQMLARFSTGDPPDIFHVPVAQIYGFAREGWLEPLDEFVEEKGINENFLNLQEELIYNNETIGVLVLGYGYVLAYNEKAFEEAGVEKPPTDTEELLEAAKQLTVDTTGDGRIDQYGFALPTVDHPGTYNKVTPFIFETGGHWTKGETRELDRESITHGLNAIKNLVEAGTVPLGLNPQEVRDYLVEGRVAMMIEGPWISGNIEQASPELKPHLRVAATPFKGQVLGGASNALAIPKEISSENKALAKEFIELFSSEKIQEKYATIAGQPPARIGVVGEEFIEENPDMGVFLEEAEKARNYMPPAFIEDFPEFRSHALTAISDVIVRGHPIEEALDELERDLERIR